MTDRQAEAEGAWVETLTSRCLQAEQKAERLQAQVEALEAQKAGLIEAAAELLRTEDRLAEVIDSRWPTLYSDSRAEFSVHASDIAEAVRAHIATVLEGRWDGLPPREADGG